MTVSDRSLVFRCGSSPKNVILDTSSNSMRDFIDVLRTQEPNPGNGGSRICFLYLA